MGLRKITIGVDWDDVLCDLNTRAIELANRDLGLDLKLSDITSWENTGKASVIKKYYADMELYERQYVTEEGKSFMANLQKKGEVFIITAVQPEFMGVRVNQIKWNQDATGVLSVNGYDDFLQLVHQIKLSMVESVHSLEHPAIIALVGPSGSGKHQMMERLLNYPNFAHPISYTTNPRNLKRHRYMMPEEFDKAEFLESTRYGGYGYGTLKKDVTDLLAQGMSVVMPLDICGAITLKRQYPTLMVYCKQSKDKLIENILLKDCGINEKKLRLLALEPERKYESLCDIIVREGEAGKILEIFGGESC